MFNLAEIFGEYTADAGVLEKLVTVDPDFDDVVAQLSSNPLSINEEEVWESALAVQPNGNLSDDARSARITLCIECLRVLAREVQEAKSQAQTDMFSQLTEALEKTSFLAHVCLVDLDKAIAASAQAPSMQKARTAKTIDNSALLAAQIFDAFAASVALGLDPLFPTTQSRDTYASLYLRPAFRLLEHELVLKHQILKKRILKIIGLGIKFQGQLTAAHGSVTQLMTYYPHTSDILAELMLILSNEYDHQQLAVLVIKDLGATEYAANDTKAPKAVGAFLTTLTSLMPNFVHTQLPLIMPLLDSPCAPMRMCVIEVLGLIAVYLINRMDSVEEEDAALNLHAIEDLTDVLALHANDINSFVRTRCLQVLTTMCETKYAKHAFKRGIPKLAALKVRDKAQYTRRQAMRLMTQLITHHPFTLIEGSRLEETEWLKRRDALVAELDQQPELPRENEDEEMEIDTENTGTETTEPAETDQNTGALSVEAMQKLQLMLKYLEDALVFIQSVKSSLDTAHSLLRSKSKADVVAAMDLFVLADAYGVETAKRGIRDMVHLVWAKANNDEKDAIKSHAVNAYYDLFMTAPPNCAEAESALYVAKSLIELSYGATTGELTSLEYLLSTVIEDDRIHPTVTKFLWRIYALESEIPRKQRRGAAIILGMLAKHNKEIALSGADTLLKIGLGPRGRADIELARYTCIILQCFLAPSDWRKGEIPTRLPRDHGLCKKLCELLVVPSNDTLQWFGLSQEALRAINDLAEDPHALFTDVITKLHCGVFGSDGNQYSEDERQRLFAQLIFVLGEIGLRILVHMERCELAFKKARSIAADREQQKADKAKADKAARAKAGVNAGGAAEEAEEDDIDLITAGGSTEDDFHDVVLEVRERELLYSDRSLLARYVQLVEKLCLEELDNPTGDALAIAATATLSKFMCLSSTFCESHMSLLTSLMSSTESPAIKSNFVIAMGDMAVCFNHVMDNYTDFLYNQINDGLPVVQRTAVVTLTFLILGGQVKVKGQLGEMAKALESKDERISNLAHMFFSELSSKDNAIYNCFLDVLSSLSSDTMLAEQSLHRIVKFLLSFIDKERHIKQLTEKLVARLSRCETKRMYNDSRYALQCLPGDKSEAITQLLEKEFEEFGVKK